MREQRPLKKLTLLHLSGALRDEFAGWPMMVAGKKSSQLITRLYQKVPGLHGIHLILRSGNAKRFNDNAKKVRQHLN
jgi:hypothetical protein